jgi:hypothetical protein
MLNMGHLFSKAKKNKKESHQILPPHTQQASDQMGETGWQNNAKGGSQTFLVSGPTTKENKQSKAIPPHVQQQLDDMAQPGWLLN